MRWLAKALLQKSLSALPQAERANYVLQRHVTRSLPGPTAGFARRFRRAVRHVDAYEERGSGRPLADAVFYEFGAGWDLAVPLSFWALGVERQILVDLHPNVHIDLVNVSIERLGRLRLRAGTSGARWPDRSLEELEPALRHPLPRTLRRARDRAPGEVGRLGHEHEHARTHSSRMTSFRSSPNAAGSSARTACSARAST